MKTIFILLTGILLGAIPIVTFLTTLFFMADNKPVSKKPYLGLAILWLIDLIVFMLLTCELPSVILTISGVSIIAGFVYLVFSLYRIETGKLLAYTLKPLIRALLLMLLGISLLILDIYLFGPFTYKLF